MALTITIAVNMHKESNSHKYVSNVCASSNLPSFINFWRFGFCFLKILFASLWAKPCSFTHWCISQSISLFKYSCPVITFVLFFLLRLCLFIYVEIFVPVKHPAKRKYSAQHQLRFVFVSIKRRINMYLIQSFICNQLCRFIVTKSMQHRFHV